MFTNFFFSVNSRYNARAARKQFKVIITKAQEKLLQPPVFSYEVDVIQTFKVLALHMPPDSESGHLFLLSIKDARTLVSLCTSCGSTLELYSAIVLNELGVMQCLGHPVYHNASTILNSLH